MSRTHRLVIDSVLLGIVGALSAQVFMLLLHGAEHIFSIWMAGYVPPGCLKREASSGSRSVPMDSGISQS